MPAVATPDACPLFPHKARYTDPASARPHLDRLRRLKRAPKTKARPHVYACPACGGWHLGNRTRGVPVASRRVRPEATA